MRFSKMKHGVVVAAAVAVIAIGAISASTAFAAKGGNNASGGGGGGHGGHGHSSPTPTATASITLVSANPVPLGTAPTFHATGYQPGDYVYMVMNGFVQVDGVYADATGSVDYTFYQPLYVAGSYTMTSTLLNGVNSASVTFTAQ